MKKTTDVFSTQAKIYRRYRPSYPKKFYNEVLNLVEHAKCCWDCGTGNGQVAGQLADFFDEVEATDISENQLKEAVKKDNIVYSPQRAEISTFPSNKFDLITCAQAVHWFDFTPFYKEVIRTIRPNGILAIWGYGLLKIENDIDEIITHFYIDVIGPYWNDERKHIDSQYDTISFPFNEIRLSKKYTIEIEMNLFELKGYLNSWSSVQNYIKENNENPIDDLVVSLRKKWPEVEKRKKVVFPIFTKIARINKT